MHQPPRRIESASDRQRFTNARAWLVLGCLTGCTNLPPTAPIVPASLANYDIASAADYVDIPKGKTFTALCPFPTTVAGGGWQADDPDVLLQSSSPLPGGAGWTVTIGSARSIGSQIWVRVFAVCTEIRTGYAAVTANGTVSGQSNAFVETACPTPAHFASGGGVVVSDSALRPFGQRIVSQPAPERYGVWVHSLQPAAASAAFTVSAICADFTQWPGREILLSPPVTLAAHTGRTLQVDCPDGKSAIHGAVQHDTGALVTTESYPVNSGTAWVAKVRHPGLSTAVANARLQLVCVSAAR